MKSELESDRENGDRFVGYFESFSLSLSFDLYLMEWVWGDSAVDKEKNESLTRPTHPSTQRHANSYARAMIISMTNDLVTNVTVIWIAYMIITCAGFAAFPDVLVSYAGSSREHFDVNDRYVMARWIAAKEFALAMGVYVPSVRNGDRWLYAMTALGRMSVVPFLAALVRLELANVEATWGGALDLLCGAATLYLLRTERPRTHDMHHGGGRWRLLLIIGLVEMIGSVVLVFGPTTAIPLGLRSFGIMSNIVGWYQIACAVRDTKTRADWTAYHGLCAVLLTGCVIYGGLDECDERMIVDSVDLQTLCVSIATFHTASFLSIAYSEYPWPVFLI